jgi:endonuclease/exonuclease/phosphatase (EEP) superfamily protein YafD
VFQVGGWLLAGVLAWTALSIAVGVWRPWVTVVLQSAAPLAVAAAALSTWPLAAAAAALCAAHVALVAPALRRANVPAGGASLRLLVANVLDENERVDDVAAWANAQDVDAMLLMEVTPALDDALGRAGLHSHARLAADSDKGRTTLVLAHRAFVSAEVRDAGGTPTPVVTLALGDRAVTVAAVHPRSPDTPRHLTTWAAQLAGLAELRRSIDGPLVMAGDWNACRWHPPFRRLLRADLTDAHEALGRGLSGSWPAHRPWRVVPAFTRLDHALLSPEVAATSVRDLTCPGSDHRAFVVELVLLEPGMGPTEI